MNGSQAGGAIRTGSLGAGADRPRARAVAWWLIGLGFWLFCAVSLLSFDAGDAPSHAIWPHHAQTQNWFGPVGAHFAYWAVRLVGFGAAVPVMAGLAGLIVIAAGHRITMPVVRAVGVLALTAATCVVAEAWVGADAGAPLPSLAGGTVGVAAGSLLIERFAVPGTTALAVLLAVISLLVIEDRVVWGAPVWGVRAAGGAARGWQRASRATGQAAGSATTRAGGAVAAVTAPAGEALRTLGAWWAGLVSGWRSRRLAPPETDLDGVDLEDVAGEPVGRAAAVRERKPKKQGRKQRAARVRAIEQEIIDPDVEAAALDPDFDEDWEYVDEDGNPIPLAELKHYVVLEDETSGSAGVDGYAVGDDGDGDADRDEDEDESEEDEAPGAPQVFDRDTLREKMNKLNVRFASSDKKSATDDDLLDLQNAVELEGYRFPGMDLLEEPDANFNQQLEAVVRETAGRLESALRQYKIQGEVVDVESGPAITLYHVRLAPGTKVSSVNNVDRDLARAMKAVNIRIVPNMAGRDTIGIEVPNAKKEKVRLKELMSNTDLFSSMKLPMFLGKDASGQPLIGDLTRMPHMLIAGTTGSGKSVCMNTIIMSWLYTRKPNELKMVLVDPKMVEMSQFKDIPHLMCPVVTEMSKAAAILEWACQKMDERYELLAEAGCRDIVSYNEMEWEEKRDALGAKTPEQEAKIPKKLPYMVFIIDELADLMMTAKEVEGSIIRIAQKARAVGIHLILATQRPQADVVTGLIKANMPCRVTFKVRSSMDSRIVLDQKGGELLLGQGDMLYLSPSNELIRAQGTLTDDKEIRRVCRFMKDVATPTFERSLVQLRPGMDPDEERVFLSENNSSASLQAAQEDPLFDRAVEIVLETKRGSVSLLQRRLAIGYTRSSRLIDLMGIAGIISDHKGSVARDVLISVEEWEAMKELHEEMRRAQGENGLFEDDEGEQHAAHPEDDDWNDDRSGGGDPDEPTDGDEQAAGVSHGTDRGYADADGDPNDAAHVERTEQSAVGDGSHGRTASNAVSPPAQGTSGAEPPPFEPNDGSGGEAEEVSRAATRRGRQPQDDDEQASGLDDTVLGGEALADEGERRRRMRL